MHVIKETLEKFVAQRNKLADLEESLKFAKRLSDMGDQWIFYLALTIMANDNPNLFEEVEEKLKTGEWEKL